MSARYEASIFRAGAHIDTLEVGGDDGSLPVTVMGPDTAREELTTLAHEEHGSDVTVGPVRLKGTA